MEELRKMNMNIIKQSSTYKDPACSGDTKDIVNFLTLRQLDLGQKRAKH